MGLFSKKHWCFKNAELTEKVPQNLIKIATRIKAISKEEVKDIKAVLCTPAKDCGQFIISTNTDIILFKLKWGVNTADRYSISSLTSITMQTKKLLMYLVLTIGGTQTVFTEIYGEVDDLNAFISSVNTTNTTNTDAPTNNTATDIREYKKLLDDGIITEEEFNAKKKQLLGL